MSATILGIIFLAPALLFLSTSLNIGPFKKFFPVLKTVQVAVFISLISSGIGIYQLIKFGANEISLFKFQELGLVIRIDALSMIMFLMISIIALV